MKVIVILLFHFHHYVFPLFQQFKKLSPRINDIIFVPLIFLPYCERQKTNLIPLSLSLSLACLLLLMCLQRHSFSFCQAPTFLHTHTSKILQNINRKRKNHNFPFFIRFWKTFPFSFIKTCSSLRKKEMSESFTGLSYRC